MSIRLARREAVIISYSVSCLHSRMCSAYNSDAKPGLFQYLAKCEAFIIIVSECIRSLPFAVVRSADKGAEDSSGHTSEEAEIKLLSPAVNLEAPVLDDSVRCRMAGICEGLDACGRGM